VLEGAAVWLRYKLVVRLRQTIHSTVMAGLVPAIHELQHTLAVSVDARHKSLSSGRA
jgi:hypothetical protein